MKHITFSIIMLTAVWMSCNKPEPPAPPTNPYYIRTWEDVLRKAAKYGIADNFQVESENNALRCVKEEELEEYFARHKKAFERRKLWFKNIEEGKKVQCLTDYFRVVNAYPERRDRLYESEASFAALEKEYLASNYRFFINMRGSVAVPFLIVVTKPEDIPDYNEAREIPNR